MPYGMKLVIEQRLKADRGEVVGEFKKEEISREELVNKMIQLHESGKIKVEL